MQLADKDPSKLSKIVEAIKDCENQLSYWEKIIASSNNPASMDMIAILAPAFGNKFYNHATAKNWDSINKKDGIETAIKNKENTIKFLMKAIRDREKELKLLKMHAPSILDGNQSEKDKLKKGLENLYQKKPAMPN